MYFGLRPDRNGIVTALRPGDSVNSISGTNSIFVDGSGVYIPGSYFGPGAGGESGPVYWKNGVETVLAKQGSANSIYIR